MRAVLSLIMSPCSGCGVRGCICRRGCGDIVVVMVAIFPVGQGASVPCVSVVGQAVLVVRPVQRVTE